MAGRKNQFNLSDKQIEAAAKTGREKTQKAYAEKADIIAKGYPTSTKKTGASGSSNTGKKNQFSGKRTTGDGATRVDQVMAAAINSTLSAFQKLAADNTSSTGSLSMGESARAAINEAKTAKKEGRQVRPGQAQRKAEQDKVKSFNDGWAGDFKQKLLEGAQKSAESAYESERHAKEGLGKFGQGVVDFGIAGAQFAGDALLNAVAPGAGLAAMAGRAYGSASLDAQQRGLSEGEQQISGLKSAAIEMLTEKLFGSVSKVAYGKGIIRNESLVNSLVNRLAKTDRGRTALKVLVGANEEGMEEVLSDILNPIADRILKLDDGKGDWSDLADDYDTQQMLEDYIIGGALGLVGAGTNVVSGQYRAENAQQRAYEEYQRQLVNAGLATEQGGDAQLTAEKYKSIIDQSTQRGKRNLSDKETANLESLIRGTYAQEDASDVSTRLAQLGTDVSEQTVNAIVKAVNGETLSRAEQKAFDANPYSQRVVNEMLDAEGVTSNEWYADRASTQSFTPEVSSGINKEQAQNVLNTSTANNPQFVNSMARQYEVAPEVVERTYNLNPTAPQAFETAFKAVYQMGQQGTDKAALGKVPVLSTAQANIAYQMGADSVMSTETTAPVTNNNTQEVNDNGVRIHNVAERINGQNTEGQIRGVETGTGENVAGGSQKEQGGAGAAQIKAGEKVSYKGKQQKGVYYAAEDTEDMKKGRKLAESYGYKVTYFVGGNIRYAGGEFRGVVDTAKKTVMVRADHPDYTAEQIMRHEMGHAAFENGDLSIDKAREMLLDEFTADEINELIEIYNSEYGGILSAEEAFEEICCDALGRMNIFEGTDLNSESYGKAQDTVRKYAAERTGSKGRAPPQNGAKWSIEPINSYGGDVSPKSGSLKFSLQENDNITARTMKYYDKHRDDIEHISRAELEQANGIVDEMVDYMTPYLDRTNNKGLRFLPEEILGDTRFDNGSYGKTIENTTICFRTLAYIDFTNDIKEKIGRPLTVEESFLASQMLYDIAKEPQCLYCYVSLDRKAYDAFLLEYIKQRDTVITEYDALGEKEKEAYRKRKDKSNGKKDPLFKKFLGKRKATNNMRDRFNAWITLAENGDSLIGLSDLTTEEKRSQIKSEGGAMADQMYDIEQYAQSASWAKKLEQYRSYNGEILRMSDDLVNTLNSEYGLRFYSFSEYTPAFIVENMQQIRDAALKGFKGLAYTKKPDFARIFAPTGMNINISVFARMDNGKIVPDTLQGADWGEVQELRSQYDNVGAVFVATTDEMVDWALEQDWIDVVIPFHIVRTGANVAEFYKWVNHTSQQADKKRNKNGRPGKKADITPPEHNNDFETYKRLVEKRNLIPRFEKWYGKDNYMKLVNETRRAASETPLLKPNFDENTLSEAIKSFDTFVEDGGYYGGWYEDGTDYGAAVDTVANDILSGKRANEVLYGRQDFDASEAMKHRKERQHGRKFSLEPVKPIQPKNGEWERGSTTDEVRAKHPDLWAVDAESSESRNPTQISGTVKSYRKIYDALKAEGFDGTVLDASSGLGYGTRAGIEEYGFNVEDIEPFPDSSYKPKYTDYSKLHKKYDVIISNAVLNVLPQDQRDALVVKMGQMLNDGGRMFINVRGIDVRNASSKVPIDEANMEYYISNTGSYQKGFTKKELVAYLSDALGKDYTVVGTNKFGAVSAVVTKQAEVSKKFSREPERLNELRRQNERKLAQATAEDAANENERGLIRDYQKQYSKVEGIREKLSAAQQTLTEAEDSGADYDTTTKAKNRFTLLSKQYAREHRKLNGYGSTKALQNVLKRVSARTSKDAGHIDNRNFSSVSDRSVKPFQMEHPELHKYYEDMAQTVLYDIGMATQFRTTNGYPKTKFTDEFKRALGGSSFNDGLQALLDISNDQGSENYALAKRMELFLDDLLTNGYKGASGNAEYIRAKENISGGNTAWENYLEENSLAIADGLITEKDLYQEFMQMRSDLPEGMGAASANFTGEETVGERWVTEAQGKGDSALHPISKEQEANLAEQQQRAPQEIPKEDLNGKLTSKHVSTIANSGMTPAEFSDALREDAALGKFSHIAYSDEEALKKANRTIEIDGWEQALANYKAEINSGRVSKDNTVMGIALYNNAVNSGDYATAMDIASLMVKNSTNTAQSLQAMRILNKLSPECRLYLAAKSIENIEEDLNERYKDNKADIHVDKILYDEYAKALRQGDEDGIKTAWANIEQSVAQQINATWYEKLNNFRYLAMLGNPRTHVRNIVGNAFFVPVRAVKNTIAYGLENIADAKINGGIERSKAILNSSNAADAALVKYAMSDYEAVQEVILSGGKYVDTFQGIDKHRTIYKTKILEAARKGNSAALDAEDAWFCKPAYANALAKWYKANGITAEQLNTGKVPEETIIKAQTTAIKEAQKATYRDTNWFSAQVSRLGKVDNKVAAMLIEGVLPFKKTPANILARAVEYSPVGLIKSLALDTKKVKAYVNGDIENGMSPAEFIDDISAGLTGSALMGLGILLASWGVLSGGDDDDEKQNYFDELSGKQNYALSIGGMSITLDWLAPESMPLFVGVELFNSLSSKNEDKGFLQNLMSSVMSLSTPMFEMSMLQSVNDLFDNLAYIKQGQGTFKIVSSMAANYISQYFPTLFGQGERAFGETQRETTYVDRNSAVGSELQYMWGKIANKIPFYDFSQIPYIDAWGRTEETGNLFERMLNNFVNPAYVKKERPTEIDGELERLYDLGETSVYPSRAKTNTKINGEYLTADEYVKYATTKGQTSYELAQGVINSAAYSGAADPEKAYMLKYVYSYADHIAKYEVNNDYSLAKWEMAAYKSANPMQAIIDHAREYYNPDKEN